MAQFLLANAIRVGGIVLSAGSILDTERGDPVNIDGAVLIPLTDEFLEIAATATRLKLAGQSDALSGFVGSKTSRSTFGSANVLWALDGSGDVSSWADVMVRVGASKVPLAIWLKAGADYTIPVGTHVMNDAEFVVASGQAGFGTSGNLTVVRLPEGAVLKNLSGIGGGLSLRGQQTATPSLQFDYDATGTRNFFMQKNTVLSNAGGSPMIVVGAGHAFVLTMNSISDLNGTALIHSINGGVIALSQADWTILLPNDWATGDGSSVVAYNHDGSTNFPVLSTITTVLNRPYGQSGGSGPTTFRPGGSLLRIGTIYFDTTLGFMIWWTGTAWVNSVGVPV